MREKFLKNHFSYDGVAVGFKCDEVLLPNRRKGWREYLIHPSAVAVIPFLDSPRKVPLLKCRIVMVQQYRYPIRRVMEEIPAGKLDKKESTRKCLVRELKEETGYSSDKFYFLTSFYPTGAFSNEQIYVYWTDKLIKGKNNPDEDEFLEVKIDSFENVLKKVKNGEIRDSKTIIAILSFVQFPAVQFGKK